MDQSWFFQKQRSIDGCFTKLSCYYINTLKIHNNCVKPAITNKIECEEDLSGNCVESFKLWPKVIPANLEV